MQQPSSGEKILLLASMESYEIWNCFE